MRGWGTVFKRDAIGQLSDDHIDQNADKGRNRDLSLGCNTIYKLTELSHLSDR